MQLNRRFDDRIKIHRFCRSRGVWLVDLAKKGSPYSMKKGDKACLECDQDFENLLNEEAHEEVELKTRQIIFLLLERFESGNSHLLLERFGSANLDLVLPIPKLKCFGEDYFFEFLCRQIICI